MIDMILQIIPIKNKVALGSQKLFANRFKGIREKINYKALKSYIKFTTAGAYKVMIIWILLITIIGILYYNNIINKIWLFMISVFFYVCDLICVLIFPERFSEMTNIALRCSECTDKLCTQYCQKLRKQN